ncbi:MAG: hypothetical protein V5A85_02870 [Haloarculaceae archaeon]
MDGDEFGAARAWCTGTGGGRRRGQSSTVGIVLLLSLTLLVAGSVVAIGSVAIGETEERAEGLRAEQSFTHVDSRVARVALGESSTQSLRLGLSGAEESAVTAEYAGRLTVRREDGTTLLEQRLGAIRYDHGGRTVAVQGGGTWSGTGRESRMVSPPEFHYHDGTLTLPVVVVSPGESGTGERIRVAAKDERYDVGLGRVENQVLTVSVTSEFYAGWAEYFRTRVPESTVTVDHANETVSAELGRVSFPVAFDHAVLAQTGDVEVSTGNSEVNGPVAAGGSITTSGPGGIDGPQTPNYAASETPIDPLIEQQVADAAASPADYESVPGDRELEGGNSYYLSGDLEDSLEVDLGTGNVTLVHDGDIDLGSSDAVHVVNPTGNRTFRLFTTGNLTLKNGRMYVGSDASGDVDARHLQVYGTSDMEVGIANGGSYFEGVIYAPRLEDAPGENEAFPTAMTQCDLGDHYADTCIATGSAAVDGAIVGGSMAVKQSTELNYDPALASLSLTLRAEEVVAPPLSFLHVSVNQIRVDGAASTGPAALDSPAATIRDVSVTETGSGGREVTVDWRAGGTDLQEVTVTAVDTAALASTSSSVDASGGSASGTTTLSLGSGAGSEFQVIVAVTDGDGNTLSEVARASCGDCADGGDADGDGEDGDGDGDGEDGDGDGENGNGNGNNGNGNGP